MVSDLKVEHEGFFSDKSIERHCLELWCMVSDLKVEQIKFLVLNPCGSKFWLFVCLLLLLLLL